MAELSRFHVAIGADTSNFDKGMENVKSKLGGLNGIVKTAGAAFAGLFIARAVMQSISAASETIQTFQTNLNELSAITGASGNNLEYLKDASIALSTSIDESGIKINKSASEILVAMKLVGSAKPELLEVKEALVEVTKQAIILSQAGGKELPLSIAVEALTKIMNQFSIGAEDAAKSANILAAGAKYGAGEVPWLAQAIVKCGVAAKSAGLDLEVTTGVMELFAEKGLQAEIAGTGFRNVLLFLQKDIRNYTDGQFDFNKAVDNLAPIMNNAIKLEEIFGRENMMVGQILAQNKDRYLDLAEAVKGTNTAVEQSITNTQGTKVAWETAKNKWDAMVLSMDSGKGVLSAVSVLLAELKGGIAELLTITKDENKAEVELINTQRNSAALLSRLLVEYKSLATDGVVPVAEQSDRLKTIVSLLTGELGANILTIDKETGAYILNTQAVEDNIQAKLDLAGKGEAGFIKRAAEAKKKYNEANVVFQTSAEKMRNLETAAEGIKGVTNIWQGIQVPKDFSNDLAAMWKNLTPRELNNFSTKVLQAADAEKIYSKETIEAAKLTRQYLSELEEYNRTVSVRTSYGMEYKELKNSIIAVGNTSEEAEQKISNYKDEVKELTDAQKAQVDSYNKLKGTTLDYTTALTQEQEAELKGIGINKETAKTYGQLEKELDILKEKKANATRETIGGINQEIEKLQEELKLLDKIGTAHGGRTGIKPITTMAPITTNVEVDISPLEDLAKMDTRVKIRLEEGTFLTKLNKIRNALLDTGDVTNNLQGVFTTTFQEVTDDIVPFVNYVEEMTKEFARAENQAVVFQDKMIELGTKIQGTEALLKGAIDTFGINSDVVIKLTEDYNNLIAQQDAYIKEQQFLQTANQMISQSIVSMFTQITNAVMSGGDIFAMVGRTLGGFMQQIGAAFLAYGLAVTAFKKAFANPLMAIVTGAALIIAGGVVLAMAQKSRGLAKGEIAIDGDGTSTSDSIPVRLSKGESVISAKNTQASYKTLSLINKGKISDKDIMPYLTQPEMIKLSRGIINISQINTGNIKPGNELNSFGAFNPGELIIKESRPMGSNYPAGKQVIDIHLSSTIIKGTDIKLVMDRINKKESRM